MARRWLWWREEALERRLVVPAERSSAMRLSRSRKIVATATMRPFCR